MELKTWMELVNYRISEGCEYGWNCYGEEAYCLDSFAENYSLSVIFDKKTQIVYEANVFDYVNNRAYRYIPSQDYKEAYTKEAKERNVENMAWDDVPWIDLEVQEDFLEKSKAIQAGEEYDTRIIVPLNLEEKELMTLFNLAHEADMTFNQFVEKILIEMIEMIERLKTEHLVKT